MEVQLPVRGQPQRASALKLWSSIADTQHQMQGSAYSLLVETAALFVCWVGLAAWQSGPGASRRREALTVCALLWFFLIGTVLEDRSMVGCLTGDTLRLFAVCTLPAFWWGLAGYVARLDLLWRVRLLPWLLALPGLTVWLLLHARPWAELVRSSQGALVSGGLFESVPVSQRDLLNSLSVGLVIANPAGLVLQINPAALERLGLVEAEEALGRDLDAVLNDLVRNQQVEIQPIREGDETLGLCAVITGRSAPWPKQGTSGRTAA